MIDTQDPNFDILATKIQSVLPEIFNAAPVKYHELLAKFTNNFITNRLHLRMGNESYKYVTDPDPMTDAYGIEIPTFSKGFKLTLAKRTLFDSNMGDLTEEELAELDDEEKELEANKVTEGSQAILHILDDFVKETDNITVLTASFLFIAHMVVGLSENIFLMEEADNSDSFQKYFLQGVELVVDYCQSLGEEEQKLLDPMLIKLLSLAVDERKKFIKQFSLFTIKTLKASGLYDSWTSNREKRRPSAKEAVESNLEFVGCSFRSLPKNEGQFEKAPPPTLPWEEFTTNMWNADYELPGRYLVERDGLSLTVDYLLDSKFFPAKYGFFSALEMTRTSADGKDHIIFGQEANPEKYRETLMKFTINPETYDDDFVFPIIIAGDFDFLHLPTRTLLEKLCSDPNTKKEVSSVLRDILDMSSKRKIARVKEP